MGELVEMFMQYVNHLSGGNEFLAGAIFVWAAGVATILLKDVPKAIYMFVKRHVITTMTLNNGGWQQEYVMYNLFTWLEPKMKESMSRTLAIQTSNQTERGTLSVGYGIHFFFFNKKLFWLHKDKLESSGSERQKDEVTIGTLGRSHKPFKEILDEFMPKEDENKLSLYHLNSHGDWNKYTDIRKRPLNTVAIDKEVKQDIVEQIQYMQENPEWFYERGLPHKLTYILHGPPGGGKTSLIKAVASYFNMNVCVVNLNQVSDSSLEQGLASMPANSVVIMEDFDSSKATADRVQSTLNTESDTLEFSTLTLSGLLNALDGIHPLDDCILFMTTNHLEKIDKALYRKGRVDHILEVAEIGEESIREYCEVIFPDHDFSQYDFSPVMGSVLNEALLKGKDDVEVFVDTILGDKNAGKDVRRIA